MNKIWIAILIAASTTAIAQQQPVTRVQTALNHLTVIEVAEPITMVAAGSEAFEIERHGTRVFVKPTKPDVATNLFVWTEHGRSIYELQPAGEVGKMDVLVTSVQQPPIRAAAEALSKEDKAKVAEQVLSQTLLNTQPVNAAGIKTQKNRVNVRLEDVVHGKDAIYVRYQVTNLSTVPYRVIAPNVSVLAGERSSTACNRPSTCFQRSLSIAAPACEFAIEPGFGRAPVAHDCHGRYLEDVSRFFHAESAKKTHFDNLNFTRIDLCQGGHRIVECYQIRILAATYHGRLVQGNMQHIAPTFQVTAPRMIDQNASHQLGRNREKMGAILPLHVLVIHQAHVGFVDQGTRLQAMSRPLTSHVASRQAVEFVINDGSQAVESSAISITPGPEKLGHLATRWRSGLIVRWCGFPHSDLRPWPPCGLFRKSYTRMIVLSRRLRLLI